MMFCKPYCLGLAFSLPAVGALYNSGSVIAPCDSPIYCHGEILKQVELARPFMDSKTFVDMLVASHTSSSETFFLTHPYPSPYP